MGNIDMSGPPPDQPTINLVDLQNAIKIIDYAAEQGAFRGWGVINQVLSLRNRLEAFIIAVMPEEDKAKFEQEQAKAQTQVKTPRRKKEAA